MNVVSFRKLNRHYYFQATVFGVIIAKAHEAPTSNHLPLSAARSASNIRFMRQSSVGLQIGGQESSLSYPQSSIKSDRQRRHCIAHTTSRSRHTRLPPYNSRTESCTLPQLSSQLICTVPCFYCAISSAVRSRRKLTGSNLPRCTRNRRCYYSAHTPRLISYLWYIYFRTEIVLLREIGD